jgi:hypothetical protein
VREKPIGRYRYVYLVESGRANGRTKQRIIKNLGRKERSRPRAASIGLPARRRASPSAR